LTQPGRNYSKKRPRCSEATTFPIRTLTCLPPATACSCEKIFTPPCNICCWKSCARCTGHPAPLTGSVSFPPSNPMTCRFLQRQRHFTAPARASGSANVVLAGLAPQPNRILCHSGCRRARSPPARAPVAGISRAPLVMAVHPSIPAKSVPEFMPTVSKPASFARSQ
jgi:hypothetical protein